MKLTSEECDDGPTSPRHVSDLQAVSQAPLASAVRATDHVSRGRPFLGSGWSRAYSSAQLKSRPLMRHYL